MSRPSSRVLRGKSQTKEADSSGNIEGDQSLWRTPWSRMLTLGEVEEDIFQFHPVKKDYIFIISIIYKLYKVKFALPKN